MPAAPDSPAPVVPIPQPRPAWLAQRHEDILDPALPIVDPHHHLHGTHWGGYAGSDLLADLDSGHRIVATVFIQCGHAYRSSGPESLAPVGETEAVVAAATQMAAQNARIQACAGIVGHADLRLGDDVLPVLAAHVEAGAGRFRGIRHSAARHDSFRHGILPPPPAGLFAQAEFLRGFAQLAPLNLSFEAWAYHTQLHEVLALAQRFKDTRIVLNHVGAPLAVGLFEGQRDVVRADWGQAMQALAGCPNVVVKLGGLGMAMMGFNFHAQPLPPSSEELANAWRPYVEPCLERFGAERCMFESNFPVDKGSCSYPILWNAFKRLAAGASATERRALFHDTAARIYRLPVPLLNT